MLWQTAITWNKEIKLSRCAYTGYVTGPSPDKLPTSLITNFETYTRFRREILFKIHNFRLRFRHEPTKITTIFGSRAAGKGESVTKGRRQGKVNFLRVTQIL